MGIENPTPAEAYGKPVEGQNPMTTPVPQPAPGYAQGQAAVPQPTPGVPVKPPLVPPQPGQVLTHYEMVQFEAGCCKCEGMKTSGLIALIILVRPVYDYPQGQAPPQAAYPTAQPVPPPPAA